MTKRTTYGAILKWNNTIARWRANDDIHVAMDGPRIKYLEQKIAFPMGIIIRGLNDITKKYFVLGEDNQPKYESEAEDAKPIMNGDLTREGYEVEKSKFLSTPIELKL